MKRSQLKNIIFLSAALLQSVSIAEPNPSPLPLTSNQIIKLQQLVSQNSSDADLSLQNKTPHEHIIWKEKPLDITLPLNKERMIHFSESVSFGYNQNLLNENSLVVQNNAGVLYLTAKKSFAPQRVEVKGNASGTIILMNLSAKPIASDTPIDVLIADKDEGGINSNNQNNDSASDDKSNSYSISNQNKESSNFLNQAFPNNTVSAVTLTRFAAQQLYAPKRLLKDRGDIFRVPMHTHKTVPLILDGSVIAMPLASWRGGDLFMTAVLLRNQEKQSLTLDPRSFCGHWKTATLFPRDVLSPRGNVTDSTTVFLVSNRSFATSLQVCTRGF
jgi:integrating conjugative element protein (TIGR03749 family)